MNLTAKKAIFFKVTNCDHKKLEVLFGSVVNLFYLCGAKTYVYD